MAVLLDSQRPELKIEIQIWHPISEPIGQQVACGMHHVEKTLATWGLPFEVIFQESELVE